MKAAVYHGRGDVRIEHVDDPTPGRGELVLQVHATGICGTDAAEFDAGPMLFPITTRHHVTGHLGPMIPGHEIAGRVVACGPDVVGLAEGELVVTGAGSSCGTCTWCRAGKTNLCVSYWTVGLQRDGGLAQYCAVPASTCLSVEQLGLSGDTAAMAQPMSIAVHSMRQGRPEPADRVVVVGAGGIGAFLTYALVDAGVEVIVADLSAERVAIAANVGAAVAFQPARPASLLEELRERAPDPSVVYEVTGNPAALEVALGAVARGGRVVAVGLQEQPVPIDARALTLREIELIGTSAHAFGRDLPTAVELLASRGRPWDDFASVALGLDSLVDEGIVPLVERRSTQLKTLIDPWIEGSRPGAARGRRMKVGFVGLGNMGAPMAGNLVAAGHDVTAYNRTRSKAEQFCAETGATLAESPAVAAAGAEIVITMLFDASSLVDVYTGESGIAAALTSGQVAVEMSTSGPEAIEWLAGVIEPTGASLVDAPVSGSLVSARAGELLIMAGGDVWAVERVRPALEVMGRSVVHLGPLGCGATMKLAVNSIVYGLNQSLSEGLVLAERAGIARSLAYDIFADSPIAAPVVHYRREVFEHPGGPVRSLSIRGSEKDLRLALDLADRLGAPMGQARYNVTVLEAARLSGFGDRDVGEVAEYLRRATDDPDIAPPPV